MFASISQGSFVLTIALSLISHSQITTNNASTELDYIPVVLLGYDVVAYHLNVTGCNSIIGSEQYKYILSSADANNTNRLYEFWFADQNNLNIFATNPWRYAPRNGGFCSWGTCCELQRDGWPWNTTWLGPPAGPDPNNCGFRIHTNGYLYFNIWDYYDQLFFNEDTAAHIAAAEQRWIGWFGSLKAGIFNHQCFSTTNNFNKGFCTESPQPLAPRADTFEFTTVPTQNPISSIPTQKHTLTPTIGQHPANPTVPDGVVLDYVPVVLLGYDVVAYHLNITGCNSLKGKRKYAYNFTSPDEFGINRIYQFWFADENNRNIFKNNPWKYAPRNGGFCSWGTCCEKGKSWPWSSTYLGPPAGPDPMNCGFRIHTNGYLYFNIWKSYDELFFGNNMNQHMKDAEERWINWFGSLQSGVFNHQCFSTGNNFGKGFCTETPQAYAPAVNPDEEIFTTIESMPENGLGIDTDDVDDTDDITSDHDGNKKGIIGVGAVTQPVLIAILILVIIGLALIVLCLVYRQRNKALKNKVMFIELDDEDKEKNNENNQEIYTDIVQDVETNDEINEGGVTQTLQ